MSSNTKLVCEQQLSVLWPMIGLHVYNIIGRQNNVVSIYGSQPREKV